MKVPADYICEHGLPQPWATCVDCMYLAPAERPEPPIPPPPPRTARRGQMPATPDDPLPRLVGDKDMSYPVHDFEAHMLGPRNSWLFAENGFPWDLRPGGWVYLRHDGILGARGRVDGIGFRTERRQHTGEPDDVGPGPTIEIDPNTWESTSIDLGDLAETQRQGYRYLITALDGTVTHLSAGDSIPDDLDIDPPAPHATPDERA